MAYTATSTVVTEAPVPQVNRQTKRTSTLRSPNVLEWPQVVRGNIAWDNSALPSEEETILTLTENEVEEVKCAVRHFNRKLTMPIFDWPTG